MSQGEPGQRTPSQPHVFECRLCGKVFDSRAAYPTCPECDSDDVEEMG